MTKAERKTKRVSAAALGREGQRLGGQEKKKLTLMPWLWELREPVLQGRRGRESGVDLRCFALQRGKEEQVVDAFGWRMGGPFGKRRGA